ncbi:DUF2116 family Zn-ribbon domain-containing protein [Aquiflexum sp.]|uniref:DUF2116 family Zn-ribbon domain-containing protein n=1 Tax=Aquiflexum sp. TaxID=1872584 RepID=UPI003593EF10
MYIERKHCEYCGKLVHGRSDKKFCDDYCRSSFNNERRVFDSKGMRNIINTLKLNRNILESIVAGGVEKVKVPKEKLVRLGYNFKYHTHIFTDWKGNFYTYSFDYGFLQLENEWLLVLRDIKELNYNGET